MTTGSQKPFEADVAEAPTPQPSQSTKRQPDTFIMVDGGLQPAAGQPPQSELQGAFTMSTGKNPRIVIDMKAALPIAQDVVRAARAAAFLKNDAAYMRAAQARDVDGQEAIIKRGDKLRDAPADKRLTDAKDATALLAAVDAIVSEF